MGRFMAHILKNHDHVALVSDNARTAGVSIGNILCAGKSCSSESHTTSNARSPVHDSATSMFGELATESTLPASSHQDQTPCASENGGVPVPREYHRRGQQKQVVLFSPQTKECICFTVKRGRELPRCPDLSRERIESVSIQTTTTCCS